MASGVRKLSWMKSPRVAANWSLRSTTMAVWGMGSPSGWRNRATTANQSARPPTIDAAAVACTYSAHVESPPHTATTTNTTLTAASSDVARRLDDASCRRRSCSEPTRGPPPD